MNYTLFIILCIIIIFYILSLFLINLYDNKNKHIQNVKNEVQEDILNKIDDFEKKKDKINIIMVISIFIIIFIITIYFIYNYGFTNGLWKLFLTWVFFTIATPTPQSGLLISIPVKFLYKIKMDKCQLFLSIFSLIIILILHFKFPYLLDKSVFGKIMDKIIKDKSYLVLITSMIASTTSSGVFDSIIDIFNKKTIQFDKLITYIILTCAGYYYYNKDMTRFNLYKIFEETST
jgi:hypothetical protein